MLEKMWRNRNTYTVGGNVNQFNHCERQCGNSSRIQKQKYYFTQQSHCLVYNQRIINHSIIKTHAHVFYCGTVYDSKNLELTQMPINDRLDKENVAHMHHGILCSHKKGVHVLCRDIDETENHNSQQTDTRTENQPLYV